MTTAPFGTFPQSAAMRILLVPLGGLEDQNPALFDRYCALFDTVPTLPLSGMTSPGRWSQKHSPFRHFNWLSSTNALQFRWVRFRKSKSGATEGGRGAAALRGGQADPWRDFQAHRRIYGAVGVLHYPSFAAAGLSEADARAEMEAALVEFGCGHDGFDNVVWRICVFDQPFDDYNRRGASPLPSPPSSPGSRKAAMAELEKPGDDDGGGGDDDDDDDCKEGQLVAAAAAAAVVVVAATAGATTTGQRKPLKKPPMLIFDDNSGDPSLVASDRVVVFPPDSGDSAPSSPFKPPAEVTETDSAETTESETTANAANDAANAERKDRALSRQKRFRMIELHAQVTLNELGVALIMQVEELARAAASVAQSGGGLFGMGGVGGLGGGGVEI